LRNEWFRAGRRVCALRKGETPSWVVTRWPFWPLSHALIFQGAIGNLSKVSALIFGCKVVKMATLFTDAISTLEKLKHLDRTITRARPYSRYCLPHTNYQTSIKRLVRKMPC